MMKEMNSLTHSCMHSFASFAILAFSGSAVFIIRATGAKFLMLASEDEVSCFPDLERGASGDGDEESWDMIGLVTAVTPLKVKRLHKSSMTGQSVGHVRVVVEAMPVRGDFNLRRILCARKSEKRYQRLTICYWKPSVLLLDLELVTQT